MKTARRGATKRSGKNLQKYFYQAPPSGGNHATFSAPRLYGIGENQASCMESGNWFLRPRSIPRGHGLSEPAARSGLATGNRLLLMVVKKHPSEGTISRTVTAMGAARGAKWDEFFPHSFMKRIENIASTATMRGAPEMARLSHRTRYPSKATRQVREGTVVTGHSSSRFLADRLRHRY